MPTPDTPDFAGRAGLGPGPGRASPSGHDARGRVCTHTQPRTRGSEPAGLERGPGKAVKAAGGFTQ